MKLIKLFILFTISIASFVFIDQNHVNAVTTCEVITTSSPCKSEGLTEVPDGETAKCPEGFNFEGCSNKPQKGSGVVLCCHNPALVSSGKECEPQKKEDDKYYLCMTKEACSNVSGTEVAEKSTPSVCTGGGSHKEICCQTPARKGETVKDTPPPAPKSYKLENPLGTSDLRVIAGKAINTFLGIVGALALLVFVYAGLSYLIAGGNDQMVTKAKNTMKYGVVGVALIMLSYALTDSFITLWTKDLPKSLPEPPSVPADLPTDAEQGVDDIKSQQQKADEDKAKEQNEASAETGKTQDPEEVAKASAKSSSSDVCGSTPATEGYSCTMLKASEKNNYDCKSGYCQSNKASNYSCCKKKE